MANLQKKFRVATLGCRTNQYESQAYATQLRALGYREALEDETADLCIVNTCTVTEGADSSSRHQIRQLARQNPGAQLVVTGCLAERLPDEIRAIEGVTHLVPNSKKEQLLSQVFPEEASLPEFAIDQFGGHTRAFVKVQDGCNSYCTYCILPYVRGRSRSRRVDDILQEIRTLVTNGYKEIVLTGINIGDFDGAPQEGEAPVRLAALVRAVDQIEGVERLRLSSIDPDEVDEELLQAIIEGKRTCHSMHIVLQSGSNAILKRMNRKYTRQIFLDTVAKLSAASPDFTYTTDVIVGFPGETELDFEESLEIVRRVKFAKVHMFPYSPRERTRAALYPNQIPKEVMQERKQRLLRLSEKTGFELRNQYVGRQLRVLIESEDPQREGWMTGYTDNFLRVSLPLEAEMSNQLVEVDCLSNAPDGLIAQVLYALCHC